MADKKTYYKLDEIGFLGTQEKISAIKYQALAKETAEFIQARKKGKVVSIPNTVINKAAK